MEEFQINGEFITLVQLLKITGLCMSGGEAKMVVSDGLVLVNGRIELQKRKKLLRGDIVELEGEKIKVA